MTVPRALVDVTKSINPNTGTSIREIGLRPVLKKETTAKPAIQADIRARSGAIQSLMKTSKHDLAAG
jgi:hypothetical protein